MQERIKEKTIVILTILLFIALFYFCINVFNLFKHQAIVEAYNPLDSLVIFHNRNPIDIDEILLQNKNINIREEMIYEEIDLDYTTQYINNEKLPSGTIHVSQIGLNGIQDVITIKKYNGEELISEKIVANNVKKASVNKIVEIGTGKRKK